MKKIVYSLMIATAIASLASCSTSNDWDDIDDFFPQDEIGGQGGSTSAGQSASTAGDLANLSIEVDSTSTLTETENIPSDDEDYVENSNFKSKVTINYAGSTATSSGSVSGVSISIDGADVTVNSTAKGVEYVLSGFSDDGSFKVYGEKKYKVTLNGVNLKNNDGPAFNDQSGKRVFVVVNDGTFNSFTDGTSYASSTEDQKGAMFAEGKLLFSGTGKLRVYGNTKAGISADDYIVIRPGSDIYVKSTAGNGIKANDGIYVYGGIVNVETSAAASKGLSSDSLFTMTGGRVTAITSGGGEYDSDDNDISACAGVKADADFTMSGGELLCKSTGTGGKGISVDGQLTMNDGTIKIITEGRTYAYNSTLDSKAKGIKADGNMELNGGSIMVKATGGDGSEGIESKGTMHIAGGSYEVYSYDDALNSALDMTIDGGYIYAFGIGNDGIDSNGNLYINGGTIVAYGTAQPEQGLDAAEGKALYINGGTVIGIGGGTTYPSSASKQPSIVYGGSVSEGSTLALQSGSTNILALTMGRSYNGAAVFLISSPSLKSGGSYDFYTGASASGTSWHGLISDATITSSGTSVASVSSLSSPYSQVGNVSGGGPGGGQGGRPGGGGPGGR